MVRNAWLHRVTDAQLGELSKTFGLRQIDRQTFVDFFDPIVSLAAINLPHRVHSKDVKDHGETIQVPHPLADQHPVVPAGSYGKALGHALADWIFDYRTNAADYLFQTIILLGTSYRLYSLDFYLRQNLTEREEFLAWPPGQNTLTFNLRWLARRVLRDGEDVPEDDAALVDVVLSGSPPLKELILAARATVPPNSTRNLLVCVQTPETLRFITIILQHLNIRHSTIYPGMEPFMRYLLEKQSSEKVSRVLLYQYSELKPSANLQYNCFEAILLEPPMDPRSHDKVKDMLFREGQQFQPEVRSINVEGTFSEFIAKYSDPAIWRGRWRR